MVRENFSVDSMHGLTIILNDKSIYKRHNLSIDGQSDRSVGPAISYAIGSGSGNGAIVELRAPLHCTPPWTVSMEVIHHHATGMIALLRVGKNKLTS